MAARALGVALEHQVLTNLGLLRQGLPGDERARADDGEQLDEEQRSFFQSAHCFTTFSSCGPGPSGSLWAMPKWQSMQVSPFALAPACRALALSDCFSGSMALSW